MLFFYVQLPPRLFFVLSFALLGLLLTFFSLRREGEVTSCFYLIVAGVLDVYQEEARHDTPTTRHDERHAWFTEGSRVQGEQRRLVRSLGRGQFFGESALGCDHQAKRTATVVARTGVTLLSLPSAMYVAVGAREVGRVRWGVCGEACAVARVRWRVCGEACAVGRVRVRN